MKKSLSQQRGISQANIFDKYPKIKENNRQNGLNVGKMPKSLKGHKQSNMYEQNNLGVIKVSCTKAHNRM